MSARLALAALWLLCFFAAILGLIWMACAIVTASRRAWTIAIGFDQLGNATAGGDEDETISARCWRLRARQPYRLLRVLIDRAFAAAGERDHCKASFIAEQRKAIARIENDGRGIEVR